jgi:hypothetical protein
MNHLRRILAAVITLTGAVLALATAPAAFRQAAAAARLLHRQRRERPGDRHHRGRHARLADHPDRGRHRRRRGRPGRPAGPRLGGTQDPTHHRLNPPPHQTGPRAAQLAARPGPPESAEHRPLDQPENPRAG